MQVKCVINDLAQLEKSAQISRLRESIHIDGPISSLDLGKTYDVQAIENWDGYLWYYIHTVDVSSFPYPYPAEFFEVIDASLPKNWIISLTEKNGAVVFKRLTIPQWANDDLFYEHLVDDDPDIQRLYNASLTNPA